MNLQAAMSLHNSVCEKITGRPAEVFDDKNLCFKVDIAADRPVNQRGFDLDRVVRVAAGKVKISFLSGMRQLVENDQILIKAGSPHTISSEAGGRIEYWFQPGT